MSEWLKNSLTFRQPTLSEAKTAKNYLNEKELRAMGQLVSGYLDFAERQAEREQAMTMADWARHLDGILTSTGEKLLIGAGSVSHEAAMTKAETEYKKYKNRVLSGVEKDYLQSVKDRQLPANRSHRHVKRNCSCERNGGVSQLHN